MKLLNAAHANDFSSAGLQDTRRFGFEMNAIAFHAVINGIYSNKIEAPVREYATNAFDAHHLVGKGDKPFLIMAPSTLNPYFMVRDFGPGMDHAEVTERATTLFGSNKRDRNDQVGMLGLGMKSAFAYTNQYTITCFDGTNRREYVCFLDDGGNPNVSLVVEEPSTEPTGVMVKFPIQQGDIQRFQTAIEKVMIGFDPMPIVLNDVWGPSKLKVLMEGENFRVVKSGHITRPFVRQGCVLYPLNLDELFESPDHYDKQIPVIVDIPIGTASVSTSREQLGYDEPTKKNLREIWIKTRASITVKLQDTFDAIDDFHEACERYSQLVSSLPVSIMKCDFVWRGQYQLRAKFRVLGSTSSSLRATLLPAYGSLEWNNRGLSRKRERYGRDDDVTGMYLPSAIRGAVIALEDWECSFAKDRVRRFRQDNPQATVLWVKDKDAKAAQGYFGLTQIVNLRDHERLKLVRERTYRPTVSKHDIRRFDRYRTISPVDDNVVYISTEGNDYNVLGRVLKYDEVYERYIRPLRNLGNHDLNFIVLLKSQRSLLKTNPDWVHLDQLLKNVVDQFDPRSYVERLNAVRFSNRPLVTTLHDRMETLPKRMRELLSKVEKVGPATYGEETLLQLWRTVTGKTLPEVKCRFSDRFAGFLNRYPLLEVLRNNGEHLDHYLKLIAR